MKITQIYTQLGHFRKDFCDLWGVVPFNNPNDPCVFFGVFDQNDINAIRNHKGFKLVWFVNARGNQYINELQGIDNLVVKSNPYLTVPNGMKQKDASIMIKDYSMFVPTPMGDMVYCYIGTRQREGRMQLKRLKSIEEGVKYEFIYGYLGHPIKYVRDNYYDKCFININLTEGGGRTTVREMAAMGRKTVMNTKFLHPAIIPFTDDEHIKYIINQEAAKIGTLPPPITGDDDSKMEAAGDEWLDVEYWLKEDDNG